MNTKTLEYLSPKMEMVTIELTKVLCLSGSETKTATIADWEEESFNW